MHDRGLLLIGTPMRRSICVCEPNAALAGEVGTWTFSFTPASALPKGTMLKFDPMTQGREIDWEVPSIEEKETSNAIWLELPSKKKVAAAYAEPHNEFAPAFTFTLPIEVKGGETFSIMMGSLKGGKESGNRAQTTVQRRRSFFLYIDPKGKGDFRDPEVFHMDIRGNKLDQIRVVAPSVVSKNKRFDVLLRFEDCFSNPTGNAPEGTLIELSYEHLRENLTWKVFVPETGYLNLPNLYFNEPGVYRIQLYNTATKQKFYSDPIRCFAENDKALFWGTLHGESEKYDAAENIDACLRHLRDERAHHFFASSPFENEEETPNDVWKKVSTQIAEFNEEGRFATFLGFQWAGEAKEEGLRHIIYHKDSRPLMRRKDVKYATLKKIYKFHSPKEIISIPSFTMSSETPFSFEEFQPEFERVVEIYNAWGSSETGEKQGNPRPIQGSASSWEKGSIQKALQNNCRFGFVAGGLDDRGCFANFYDSDQAQYTPGMTAILTADLSREKLFEALYNRSCYATTGAKILIGLSIAGSPMGTELDILKKPGLSFNRHITGYVAGTAPIKEVSIIRNGEVFQTYEPKEQSLEITLDDTALLEKCSLPCPNGGPRFAYYYLRAVQEDGHMAWSSPIWIDLVEGKAVKKPKKG